MTQSVIQASELLEHQIDLHLVEQHLVEQLHRTLVTTGLSALWRCWKASMDSEAELELM